MRTGSLFASFGAAIVVLACGPSPTTPDSDDAPQLRGTSATSTGPSVPIPQAPAAGAALAQPIGLSWSASTAGTPIIAYNWQVATTSAFTAVIAWGSTFEYATASPSALNTQLSGLANGTYFWHVQAVEQGSSTTGPVQGGWSAPRSFSVTGPGATAPGTPSVTLPAAGAKFHPWELFDMSWSAVPGAAYYKLEMDDEPSFAYPWTNATYDPIYGTSTQLNLGPGTVYYRIRAVGTNGVRGLPSPTRTVVIDYNAPLPPPPTPLAPMNGARVTVPFNLQWSDAYSAQGGGYYEVQIAASSSFKTVEWYVIGANASPYPVDSLTTGTKWWRIRAYHGYNANGPAVTAWSASGTFVVAP